MYTRQVKAEQYHIFINALENLMENGLVQYYYQCHITINGTLYLLQLRTLTHYRIVALKAIRFNINTNKHELITDKMQLGALTEFALMQYCGVK